MCLWSMLAVGLAIFLVLIGYAYVIDKVGLILLGRKKEKVNRWLVVVYALTMFWMVWELGGMWFIMYGLAISFILFVSVSTDVREKLIKNEVTYIAILLGFVYALLQDNSLFHLGGGLFIVVVLGVLFVLMPGKLGMGDIKLLVPIGFLVGVLGINLVLLMSSVVGLVYALGHVMVKGRKEPIPFGPFIVMSTLIFIVYGDAIINWIY